MRTYLLAALLLLPVACTEADPHDECREHADCPEGLACSFKVCVDPAEVDVCEGDGLTYCGQRCVDTLATLETCGGCGGCPSLAGAEAVACARGACTYACLDGFGDSDDNADNGCDCEGDGCGECVASGPELCDGLDNDCNGTTDDVGPAAADARWVAECLTPDNTVVTGCGRDECQYECVEGFADANDLDADGCECTVEPETCDGLDNDCDGQVDEAATGCPEVVGTLARCGNEGCEYTCDPAADEIADAWCSDGQFCNGAELCNPAAQDADPRGCVQGPLPDLSDGIDCTVDTCDTEANAAVHTPDHGACDDELFCNGVEQCHAELGCGPGVLPSPDDGEACTDRVCDEETDSVTFEPTQLPGFECIPGGSFRMGIGADEVTRYMSLYDMWGLRTDTASPQHQVEITRPLLVATTEVTQQDWSDLMATTPAFHGDCAECPVERTSWWDAVEYANRLSRRDGLQECYVLTDCTGEAGSGCGDGERFCLGSFQCADVEFLGLECEGYRLPTEAEWEYVARAGTETEFVPGDMDGDASCMVPLVADIAWYCGNTDSSQPVATRSPSPWGLSDTAGNVAEFVWDWLRYDHYTAAAEVDPLGPDAGDVHPDLELPQRGHRGGGWSGSAVFLRAGVRAGLPAAWRDGDVGFRLVRTAP